MKNPLTTPEAQNFGLLMARLPMGILFFWQGLHKLNRTGPDDFVSSSLHYVPDCLPSWFGHNFLTVLPFVEMLVGLMIALGFLTRVGAFFASLLLISFIIAVTGLADADGKMPFHPNLIFLGVTLVLMSHGGGKCAIDGWLGRGKGSGGRGKGE